VTTKEALSDIYKGGDCSCDLTSEWTDSASDLWLQVMFGGAYTNGTG